MSMLAAASDAYYATCQSHREQKQCDAGVQAKIEPCNPHHQKDNSLFCLARQTLEEASLNIV